jgi:hypothetical protein
MSSDGRWTENERQARELFDASVEGLDAEMRSRLNRARQKAVAEVERAHRNPWRAWWPAAAAASVALLAVMLWRAPGGDVDPTAGATGPVPAAEVVELLATGEDLDVASEDPEFYKWLADRGLPATNGTG